MRLTRRRLIAAIAASLLSPGIARAEPPDYYLPVPAPAPEKKVIFDDDEANMAKRLLLAEGAPALPGVPEEDLATAYTNILSVVAYRVAIGYRGASDILDVVLTAGEFDPVNRGRMQGLFFTPQGMRVNRNNLSSRSGRNNGNYVKTYPVTIDEIVNAFAIEDDNVLGLALKKARIADIAIERFQYEGYRGREGWLHFQNIAKSGVIFDRRCKAGEDPMSIPSTWRHSYFKCV